MLLAIDTASRNASIALYNAEGVQAERTWHTRENHTVELMSQIVQMLELAGVTRTDLKAIGVALGPGSFTGLRVGMSVAKGLAFGQKISILGVPTLDAIAYAHSLVAASGGTTDIENKRAFPRDAAPQPLPMYAILAAGRGRYSVAPYSARDGGAERAGDYALVNADGLVGIARAAPSSRIMFCGEIDAALAKRIAEGLGERAVIASAAMNARRAGFLAELAWGRFQRGQTDDVASLAPIYTPHS
jgi:tRNA threonylcarbamoyladenosine biosynthesis protein TsaB